MVPVKVNVFVKKVTCRESFQGVAFAEALNGSATICALDIISDISGQGFLIASEILTRQPSGPGMQPTIDQYDDAERGSGPRTVENQEALLVIHFDDLHILLSCLVPTHTPRHFFPR